MIDDREMRVEQLLRAESGIKLSPGFKHRVMQAIERLPDPELIAPRRTWRDWIYAVRMLGAGEKAATGLIVAGLVALLIPGASDLLAAWNWEVSDLTLSLSVGESVLSASVVSLIIIGLGGLFVAGAGAYSMRNNLIGV